MSRESRCPVCGEPVSGAGSSRTETKRDAGGRLRKKTVRYHAACTGVAPLRETPLRQRQAALRKWKREGWFETKGHEDAVRRVLLAAPRPTTASSRRPANLHPTRYPPPTKTAVPEKRASWRLALGEVRYLVRWLKGNPYLYRREYQGARKHSRPTYRDVYLGRIDENDAASESALRASLVRKGWV